MRSSADGLERVSFMAAPGNRGPGARKSCGKRASGQTGSGLTVLQSSLIVFPAMEGDLGCDRAVAVLHLRRRLHAMERDLRCDGAVANLDPNLGRCLCAMQGNLGCDGAVANLDPNLGRSRAADNLDLASGCCDGCVHCGLPVGWTAPEWDSIAQLREAPTAMQRANPTCSGDIRA